MIDGAIDIDTFKEWAEGTSDAAAAEKPWHISRANEETVSYDHPKFTRGEPKKGPRHRHDPGLTTNKRKSSVIGRGYDGQLLTLIRRNHEVPS